MLRPIAGDLDLSHLSHENVNLSYGENCAASTTAGGSPKHFYSTLRYVTQDNPPSAKSVVKTTLLFRYSLISCTRTRLAGSHHPLPRMYIAHVNRSDSATLQYCKRALIPAPVPLPTLTKQTISQFIKSSIHQIVKSSKPSFLPSFTLSSDHHQSPSYRYTQKHYKFPPTLPLPQRKRKRKRIPSSLS